MRLAFDMDGTITEGRYLPAPRTRADYMRLRPYDNDTMDILADVCAQHEVFIITARSETRADLMIREWLATNSDVPIHPYIITNPVAGRKNPENAVWKNKVVQLLDIKLIFDDSPNVWEECANCYLVDNPHWPENQQIKIFQRHYNWKGILETINRKQPH